MIKIIVKSHWTVGLNSSCILFQGISLCRYRVHSKMKYFPNKPSGYNNVKVFQDHVITVRIPHQININNNIQSKNYVIVDRKHINKYFWILQIAIDDINSPLNLERRNKSTKSDKTLTLSLLVLHESRELCVFGHFKLSLSYYSVPAVLFLCTKVV